MGQGTEGTITIQGVENEWRLASRILEERIQEAVVQGYRDIQVEALGHALEHFTVPVHKHHILVLGDQAAGDVVAHLPGSDDDYAHAPTPFGRGQTRDNRCQTPDAGV